MTYKAFSNQGFLFQETLRATKLLLAGSAVPEVQRRALEENLFEVRAVQSRKTMASAVLQRLADLPLEHVVTASLELQRLMVLLMIARQHRLLAETLLELGSWTRLSRVVGQTSLQRFWSEKREADVTLSGWSGETFQKTCSNILKYLTESRLLVKTGSDWHVIVPVLSDAESNAIRAMFGTWGLRMLLQPGYS